MMRDKEIILHITKAEIYRKIAELSYLQGILASQIEDINYQRELLELNFQNEIKDKIGKMKLKYKHLLNEPVNKIDINIDELKKEKESQVNDICKKFLSYKEKVRKDLVRYIDFKLVNAGEIEKRIHRIYSGYNNSHKEATEAIDKAFKEMVDKVNQMKIDLNNKMRNIDIEEIEKEKNHMNIHNDNIIQLENKFKTDLTSVMTMKNSDIYHIKRDEIAAIKVILNAKIREVKNMMVTYSNIFEKLKARFTDILLLDSNGKEFIKTLDIEKKQIHKDLSIIDSQINQEKIDLMEQFFPSILAKKRIEQTLNMHLDKLKYYFRGSYVFKKIFLRFIHEYNRLAECYRTKKKYQKLIMDMQREDNTTSKQEDILRPKKEEYDMLYEKDEKDKKEMIECFKKELEEDYDNKVATFYKKAYENYYRELSEVYCGIDKELKEVHHDREVSIKKLQKEESDLNDILTSKTYTINIEKRKLQESIKRADDILQYYTKINNIKEENKELRQMKKELENLINKYNRRDDLQFITLEAQISQEKSLIKKKTDSLVRLTEDIRESFDYTYKDMVSSYLNVSSTQKHKIFSQHIYFNDNLYNAKINHLLQKIRIRMEIAIISSFDTNDIYPCKLNENDDMDDINDKKKLSKYCSIFTPRNMKSAKEIISNEKPFHTINLEKLPPLE